MLAAMPVQANPQNATEAEQLRRLDIMLMVTNLRCRRMGQGFDQQYNRFSSRHVNRMTVASHHLVARYDTGGTTRSRRRSLDTISTRMANRYGGGHPWMDCAQLGVAAAELAEQTETHVLLAAADRMLKDQPPAQIALASEVP